MAVTDVLNDIIKNIRNSNLNFNMNLTPFSGYITIRSSFVKNFNYSNAIFEPKNDESVRVIELKNRNQILSLKVKLLKKENVDMKTKLEGLSKSNKIHDSENLKANSEASKIKEEKRVLQIKDEKVCAEIKIV